MGSSERLSNADDPVSPFTPFILVSQFRHELESADIYQLLHVCENASASEIYVSLRKVFPEVVSLVALTELKEVIKVFLLVRVRIWGKDFHNLDIFNERTC